MIYSEETKYSNCCSEVDRLAEYDGACYSDYGHCPNCKEPCEFLTANELEEMV